MMVRQQLLWLLVLLPLVLLPETCSLLDNLSGNNHTSFRTPNKVMHLFGLFFGRPRLNTLSLTTTRGSEDASTLPTIIDPPAIGPCFR